MTNQQRTTVHWGAWVRGASRGLRGDQLPRPVLRGPATTHAPDVARVATQPIAARRITAASCNPLNHALTPRRRVRGIWYRADRGSDSGYTTGCVPGTLPGGHGGRGDD